jgi:hypothetical protein
VGKLAGRGKRWERDGSFGTGRKPPTEIKNFGAIRDGCGGNEGWAFWFISWMLAPAYSRRVKRRDKDTRKRDVGRTGFNLKVEEEQGTYERREDGGHTCSLGETHNSLSHQLSPPYKGTI